MLHRKCVFLGNLYYLIIVSLFKIRIFSIDTRGPVGCKTIAIDCGIGPELDYHLTGARFLWGWGLVAAPSSQINKRSVPQSVVHLKELLKRADIVYMSLIVAAINKGRRNNMWQVKRLSDITLHLIYIEFIKNRKYLIIFHQL